MTRAAIHLVRKGKGLPLEPVGVWIADGEHATPFYPPSHIRYLERGRKTVLHRPMESAEGWLVFKASTSPNWRIHQPAEPLFEVEELNAEAVYTAVRTEFEAATASHRERGPVTVRGIAVQVESTDSHSAGQGNRIVLAQSWWVAAELVRRHPELIVCEMHPGGGQYDVLCVARPEHLSPNFASGATRVLLNRPGTIHVDDGSNMTVVADWPSVLAAANPHEVVKNLEAAAGWVPPPATPASTPRTLAYRFLATALTMLVNDRHAWDARNEFYDSSDDEPPLCGYIDQFADAQVALARTPRIGIHGEPHSHYWALRRGNQTAAVVSIEGVVYRAGHSPRDLVKEHTAAGRRAHLTTVNLLREWL